MDERERERSKEAALSSFPRRGRRGERRGQIIIEVSQRSFTKAPLNFGHRGSLKKRKKFLFENWGGLGAKGKGK